MNKIKAVLKRIFTYAPKDWMIFTVLLATVITMLIPLYRLCAYTIPYCDDYDAFLYPKEALKTLPGLFGLIKGSADYSHVEYGSFQGTFTSCFMMAFNFFVFNPMLYGLGPVMLITIMAVSVFLFIYTLFKTVFGSNRLRAASLSLIAVLMTMLFIYTAQQGFYWYDGGVHYIFMHSVLLLGLASMIRTQYSTKKAPRIVFCILSSLCLFIVSGGNYSTLTQAMVVIPFVLVVFWISKKRFPLIHVPAILVFAIGTMINITAPGNAHRQVFFDSPYGTPFKAILQSFVQGIKFLPDFLDWRTLLVLMIMLPVAHRIIKETVYRFSLIKFVIFALFSICLYASGNTAMLYSTGKVDLSRVINVIKMTFHILLILNVFYFMGLLEQFLEGKIKDGLRLGFVFLIPVWFALWMYFLKIQPNPIGSYSAWGADYYLKTGQAEQCHSEYLERLALLEGPEKDVVFDPYTVLPWFFGWKDLEQNPDAEQNRFMARYYGKNSVRIR